MVRGGFPYCAFIKISISACIHYSFQLDNATSQYCSHHMNNVMHKWITFIYKTIWMNENSELSSAYGGQVVRQVFWGKTARSQLAFIFLFVFVCKATLSWVQHTVSRFWSIRPQGPSLPNLTSHTWTLDLKTKWWRKMCQRGTEHKARHSWLDWRG